MEPHSRAVKNTSRGNVALQQDATHLNKNKTNKKTKTKKNKKKKKIRPCYQRECPFQDPAGNLTTRRPDHRKETQTEVVWTCLPLIRSDQNHSARHSERGKKIRQTEEEVGRQHHGLQATFTVESVLETWRKKERKRQAWSSQSPRGQWRTGRKKKMEETGCHLTCSSKDLRGRGIGEDEGRTTALPPLPFPPSSRSVGPRSRLSDSPIPPFFVFILFCCFVLPHRLPGRGRPFLTNVTGLHS